jgi:hypothetical protein
MAFSGVLHGVNPGLAPIAVVVDQSGTLVLDRENWVTTSGLPLELPQAPDGRSLKIINSTKAAITVNSSPGTISGVTQAGAAITAQNAVRILPGQRGKFVANGGNWIAQGCERPVLTFTYNGTPLSNNNANPRSAGGILHYFGLEQGGETWQNPTTGVATVTAAASAMEAGTPQMLSDRVPAGQNVYTPSSAGAWFGWRFPRQVRITGFIFQTRTHNSYHPRNWRIRAGNTTELVNGQDISSLIIVDTRSNQDTVNAADTYFGAYLFAAPTWGNTVIWQSSGADSSGQNYLIAQEVEFFGDVET